MLLSDLPIEVLADNLFPFLSTQALTRLACTSKVRVSTLQLRHFIAPDNLKFKVLRSPVLR